MDTDSLPTSPDGEGVPTKEASNPLSLSTTTISKEQSTRDVKGKDAEGKDIKEIKDAKEEGKGSREKLDKGHKRTSSADLKFVSKLKPSLKKNLSDAPISKELSERARSAPLVKKFNLPPTEMLINDYSAALLKHILIHGRLYVSQNYICFESKIFGIKTMEVIPMKDVTVLTKKTKKLNFTRGIEISTPSQTYYFASFVSRVRAFSLLTKLWREHVPSTAPLPDEDDDDDDDEDQDYESDDSALKKKHKKMTKENTALDLAKEKERRRFSSPLLQRVLPNGKSQSASSLVDHIQDSSASAPTSPLASSSTIVTAPPTNISHSTSSIEPPSEEEDEEEYDQGDGFLGTEAVYQPVLSTTFNVNVKNFFKVFYSDESTFTHAYREQRGDKDVSVKKWTNSPQYGMIRDVLFVSPVKVPLGPSQTRATETQRYHLTKNRMLVDTITMFHDIPYGDTFRIEGKWEVTPASTPETCKLVVSIGVHFMKKTWFKSKIESQTIKETKESFQQWANIATAEVARAQKAGITSPSTTQSAPASAATSPQIVQEKKSPAPEPHPEAIPAQVEEPPGSRRRGSTTATTFRKAPEGRFAFVTNIITSLTSSSLLEGNSLVTTFIVLVVGMVFLHMYLRIVYLEGKVAVLETILQPVLAKNM